MKKIFEIPELEVVRFVEADIVVCSGCSQEWECISYGTHGGCDNDCDAFCKLYILDPDVDGQTDNPNECEEWRSGCSEYSDSGFTPSCSSYSYETWTDAYLESHGAWTFEPNSAFNCPQYESGDLDGVWSE